MCLSRVAFAALPCLMLFTACPSSTENSDGGQAATATDAGAKTDGGATDLIDITDAGHTDGPIVLGGDRPATVFVPSSYDATTAMPLVLFLHGYGFSGASYEQTIHLTSVAEERGFLYVVPEGTIDSQGSPFWNAWGAACCDFFGANVDDSGYLRSLIVEAQLRLNVDAKRIFVLGHSNGGFMSYRMACDAADLIAGVASISGGMPTVATCSPSEPVAALQVHGTMDTTVLVEGGTFGGPSYLSAADALQGWADRDGCVGSAVAATERDYDVATTGPETAVTQYDGCSANSGAELWVVSGAGHVFQGTPAFFPAIFDFLFAHPKL